MSDYDPTDFVDDDFQAHKTPVAGVSVGGLSGAVSRAPTREEVDVKVVEAQQKLAELKRAQEELERERAGLEETRRRRIELETGRKELVHNLTRGLGLLEEAEFNSRRDAEQMSKSIAALREALGKIESVHEEHWTQDNFSVELTRALTAIENARMEWNSARLKFPILSGQSMEATASAQAAPGSGGFPGERSFWTLCKWGLALTWPFALAVLASLGVLIALLFRR
jgi:hypothetical protein